MFCIACVRIARGMLPVGRFGIRKVTETSLYHNFGPLGVVGAAGIFTVGIEYLIQVYTQNTKHLNSPFGNFTDTF